MNNPNPTGPADDSATAPAGKTTPNTDTVKVADQSGTESTTTHTPNPNNAEAAKYRTQRNEARAQLEAEQTKNQELADKMDKFMQGLAKLSGQEPNTATPEDTITALEAKNAELLNTLRSQQVTADVNTVIRGAGVDPALTLAVLKADGVLGKLDPTADDYSAQVAGAVEAVVEANPRLRIQVVPASSGQAPTPTNNSAGEKLTMEDLEGMTAREIYDLRRAGKLSHLI